MKFDLDCLMARSYVLTRDKVRYSRFCSRMKSQGFTVLPKMYYACDPAVLGDIHRHMRNAISFTGVILSALANGLDYILFFEDDAYPVTDCYKKLVKLFNETVFPDDLDILSLGNMHWIDNKNCRHPGVSLKDVDSTGTFGRLAGHLWGTHAVVITTGGMMSFLREIERRNIHSDWYEQYTHNAYSLTSSHFLQVTDKIEWGGQLADAQEFSERFPAIDTGVSDVPYWPDSVHHTGPR